MIHELKTWEGFFQDIMDSKKTFEVRVDDRGFKVGDILHLKEWDTLRSRYTGREIFKTVTYIMKGGQFGIEEGVIVMSLGEAPETTLRYIGLLKN